MLTVSRQAWAQRARNHFDKVGEANASPILSRLSLVTIRTNLKGN